MFSPSPSGQAKARGTRPGVRRLEIALYCAGIALIGLFLGVRVDAALSRKAGLSDFQAARARVAASIAPSVAPAPAEKTQGLADADAETPARAEGAPHALVAVASPDRTLWSPERVRGFDASFSQQFAAAPLAILRIPRIELEVPVLAGTDELALNRGVGHIEGTPRPGFSGNVGIAGHRDGFFRGLKDVSAGDVLELESLERTDRYRIESITIVSPDRVDVLAPTDVPTLTLVTCYPFYYIGSAPKRYIVRAALDESDVPRVAERRMPAP
jgi:LPXTG-site transpeptidase (sortase) family protein